MYLVALTKFRRISAELTAYFRLKISPVGVILNAALKKVKSKKKERKSH